jgi:hypothetical protein
MKDKEKRVRQADLLRGILGVLIILFAMVAQAKAGPLLLILTLIVFGAFLAVEFFMNRCPHCDRYLGRNFGFFCQHCGERIRPEKADT